MYWAIKLERHKSPPGTVEECAEQTERDPAYEAMFRSRVRHMVEEIGADGFREDGTGGVTRKPGVRVHSRGCGGR